MYGSNAAAVPGYVWQQMQFLAASKGRRQQLLQLVWCGVFQAEAAKRLWQEATGQLVFKWHVQAVLMQHALGAPDKCLAHDHRGEDAVLVLGMPEVPYQTCQLPGCRLQALHLPMLLMETRWEDPHHSFPPT